MMEKGQGVERKRFMKPLKAKIQYHPIYGFDVETYGQKNKFFMGSVVGDDTVEVFEEHEKEKMRKHLLRLHSSKIFATNLHFDFFTLFNDDDMINFSPPIFSGSSLLHIKHKDKNDNKVEFYDTLNFAQMSVERLGKVLGFPKHDTPEFLKDLKYWRKPRNDKEKKQLYDYNIRDSTITQKAAVFLQKSFGSMGAQMKMTIASTSMDLFRRKYLRTTWFGETEERVRWLLDDYYGGRTEVFERGKIPEGYSCYDVNSLYPTMMLRDYPMVSTSRHVHRGSVERIECCEGLTECTVHVPEHIMYPPLPYRFGGKLLFPVGTFKGKWTNHELRFAMSIGCEIISVGEQVYYSESHTPFRQFVKDMYHNRMEYKRQNNPMELTSKLLMNSLYGKFGQKPDWEYPLHITQFDDSIKEDEFTAYGENYFMIKKKGKPSIFCHPIYSIYTSAMGRVEITKALMKYKGIYCDTDSIITKEKVSTGSGLGEWKKEYSIKEGCVVRPKMYGFMTDEDKEIVKVKGLGRVINGYGHFQKFLRKPSVDYMRFAKFKECNRRGFDYNEILDVHKDLALEDNKRLWSSSFSPDVFQKSKPHTLTNF